MPRQAATKPYTPKVITANHLIDGDVVYLTKEDRWSLWLSEAEVITDAARAETRLAAAEAQASLVVGVYLSDIQQSATGPQPTHFREEFRRTGPSNYAHGKQALRPASAA